MDVGCGTGRPVVEMLAAPRHSVYEIDIAEKMVKIACFQVPGPLKDKTRNTTHHTGSMRSYDPFSLYQIPRETHPVVDQSSKRLQDNGILVLACKRDVPIQARVKGPFLRAGQMTEAENLFTFVPDDHDYKRPEDHYLAIVRKKRKFGRRLVFEEGNGITNTLRDSLKSLI
ncbi:hypothetical protein CIHG_04453 [Coccidioides immitis H538.4]|uniref:Methyltransferase type 11 domain-containing protein n=1 Tax=Coccidioides immitis H538.4 TaxID=396776 RepID=A0A0J8RRU2_COCIT|nr:hypothetical protein CIHG_04453 [Coccidioides immitis H538.4]